jgi:hypothetical protein
MRRFLTLLLLWVGLIGATAPAFACANADAGECCPANAPSGCTQVYEQFGIEASVCCVSPAAPAQIVAAEAGRELQVQGDHGSPDPVALTVSFASSLDRHRAGQLAVPALSAKYTDASLTWLHTGRLRL